MPTITCNGADLYYEDRGSGRPLVFLHGVMAGLRYFEPQLSGLSADHRTIGLDFRGHGRSEKTADGHTVPQYARDLRAVVDRLDLDDVVLVGWSMGALVAWEYVDRFGSDGLAAIVDVDMEPTRSTGTTTTTARPISTGSARSSSRSRPITSVSPNGSSSHSSTHPPARRSAG